MNNELETNLCVSTNDPEPVDGSYFVSAYPPFQYWGENAVPQTREMLATSRVHEQSSPLGIYVHVPFCAKRCDYCYYRSFSGSTNTEKDAYVDAVIEEARAYRNSPALGGRQVSFLYFGGGTPSLLTDRQIAKLLTGLQEVYSWEKVEEVTFECAPKAVSLSKLRTLRHLGVTRLSMGVQHWDDEVLERNGRMHLVQDVVKAYDQVQEIGFDVVNLDLIVGLVGETEASFLGSVERCIELGSPCITIYQLEIPHNTPLYRAQTYVELPSIVPSWDLKRRRLASGFELLEQAGYSFRSAYTAVRDPAIHRFVYQDAQYRGADLLGLGLSSFSYIRGIHFQNFSRMDEYLEHVAQRDFPISRAYLLSQDEQMVREIVLQLKLGSVSRSYIIDKFGVDVVTRFATQLKLLQSQSLLTFNTEGIQLTRAGLLRADRLITTFYTTQHSPKSLRNDVATPIGSIV